MFLVQQHIRQSYKFDSLCDNSLGERKLKIKAANILNHAVFQGEMIETKMFQVN